jgi:hypothetical protein
MNRPAGTEKPRLWKATNETTNPLGARHGLVTGDLPLHDGGEQRKLACLDETEELLARHIGARPVRHRGGGVSGGLKAQEEVALQVRNGMKSWMRARRKKIMGSKVLNLCPAHGFKGASAAPRLRRRARCVSGTFAHKRAPPGETSAHLHDASIPAEYGPAMSAHGHDGTVTSFTSAEMPAPTTTPTFTTTAMVALTKRPQATTATITHKSSRASLQLTHEFGGYILRMRSRAPTGNTKNTINTRIVQLSLSATP